MPTRSANSSSTQPRFPFHHGRVALSFAGTVGNRGSQVKERIPTPQDLGNWLLAAALAPNAAPPSPAQYRRAIELREAIARSTRAVVDDRRPAAQDVAVINAVAKRSAPRVALDPRTLTLVGGSRGPAEAALGRIALDAIDLLADPAERARLRACGDESCASIFLTPAGRRERRWCSMAGCGNRAKVAAFRNRA